MTEIIQLVFLGILIGIVIGFFLGVLYTAFLQHRKVHHKRRKKETCMMILTMLKRFIIPKIYLEIRVSWTGAEEIIRPMNIVLKQSKKKARIYVRAFCILIS